MSRDVQREAEKVWHQTHVSDEHSDEEQAEWEDGFLAAAESRDQRIRAWKVAARAVVENIGPIRNVMMGRADLGIPRMVYVDVPEAAVAALSSLLEKGTDQ